MSELSRRYAAALYELSGDEAAFAETAEALMGEPALWAALNCPVLRAAELEAVLDRLPLWEGRETLPGFYRLLCRKGRMALLPEILEDYRALARARRGAAVCTVTCVHPPDEARQEKLRQLLCRLHGLQEVQLKIAVDEALIGGFVLELQGVVYDRSVRGRLEGLKRQLRERRIV